MPTTKSAATAMAYDDAFFGRVNTIASSSAAQVVPYIVDLVRPVSVVDVGCGLGAWLREFKRAGVHAVAGLDGPWVKGESLLIEKSEFRVVDLEQPFGEERAFDLVVSLEVAEHLVEPSAAGFVRSLTELGPVVLFSAAVPFQGGQLHVNEQWPQYWADLFWSHGYACLDIVRWRFWNDPAVAWWYAQNMLLFVRAGHPLLDAYSKSAFGSATALAAVVHPARHLELAREVALLETRPDIGTGRLKAVLAVLPSLLWQTLTAKFLGRDGARPGASSSTRTHIGV